MKKSIWIAGISVAAAAIATGVVLFFRNRGNKLEAAPADNHKSNGAHPGVAHLHRLNKKAKQALG